MTKHYIFIVLLSLIFLYLAIIATFKTMRKTYQSAWAEGLARG